MERGHPGCHARVQSELKEIRPRLWQTADKMSALHSRSDMTKMAIFRIRIFIYRHAKIFCGFVWLKTLPLASSAIARQRGFFAANRVQNQDGAR